MKKEWLYRIFTGLFFAVLLVPTVGTLALGPSEAVANESIVQPPRLRDVQGNVNWAYLSDAGDWFSKHFAFRKELITADSVWKAGLLGTSAQSNVALGKDGWLFYAETLDDYTGADNITQRQAYCAAYSLKMVQDYVEGQGGRFVFTIAPNKISLYPEYYPGYPERLKRAEQTAADKLEAALLDAGVAYADLDVVLHGEVLYHRTDSHWTNQGAALAHDVLLDALGLEGHAFEKPGHWENIHEGDLYAMLYPASKKLDDQFVFDTPLDFTYTSDYRADDDILITTAGAGEGTLLMFRDSFGNALHKVMAESFAQATFTRATPYNLMDAGQADYVVLEIVERNVARLAEGDYLMPAPEMEISGELPELQMPVQLTSVPDLNAPGYLRYTGTLENCGTNAPVYLAAGGTYYEAFPTTEGFAALLPESAQLEGVLVLE